MRAGVALLVLSALAHARPAAIVDGAHALEAGRLDDAERLLVAAKDATTRPGWRWFDLWLVHYAQGAFGRAIDACYRALQEPATKTRVAAMR